MPSSEDKLKQTDFRLCVDCNKLHMGLTSCPNCSTPLTLVDYKYFLGKSIGKYTIKDILGIGGMGIVFKAIHQALEKNVAIKIFIPTTEDPTFEQRFLREARILAGLKHSNIIEVYDFDVSVWGMPYYVMEYLEGRTLGSLIRNNSRGLSSGLVAQYLEPIIHGLSYAHSKGIVHRDLKPDNIFIASSHQLEIVKILDFGIAKSVVGDEESARLTATETVLGTPYYLTPEQILNKNIGPHTDQYSLALIIGEMLSGQIIRSGKSIGEILYKEVHNPIEPDALKQKKIPAAVGKALIKATMPKPKDRYPNIESFGSAIYSAISKSGKSFKAPEKGLTNQTVVTSISAQKTISESGPKQPYAPKKTFLSIEEEAIREEKKKKRRKLAIAGSVLAAAAAAVIILVLNPFGEKGDSKIDEDKKTIAGQQTTTKPPDNIPEKTKPAADLETKPVKTPPKDLLKPKLRIINAAKTITPPPETLSILSYYKNNLVLNGSEDIYIIDLNNPGKPSGFTLEERILGGLPKGNIAFINDFTVTSRNLIDGTDDTLLRNPPAGKIYELSQSQRYLAVKKTRSLTVYRITNKKITRIKSIPSLKPSTRFFMKLSDNHFAFINAGRIYGYQLGSRGAKEMLNLPFNQSEMAVEAMAIQDKEGLLAVGGKFEKVYLYNLKKRNVTESIPLTGYAHALDFIGGSTSPTLLVGQNGALTAWQKGKDRAAFFHTASYKTGKSTVKDFKITPSSIIVLALNPNKIYTFKR